MHKNEASPNTRAPGNHLLVLLCSVTFVVLVATILSVTGRGMRVPERESLSVNDGRPVALAAETLEKKYGWIITYETRPMPTRAKWLTLLKKSAGRV